MECIATFDTTHMALFFEKACRERDLKARIVPVPREISASCGLACDYPCELEEKVRAIIAEKGIEVSEWHKLGKD